MRLPLELLRNVLDHLEYETTHAKSNSPYPKEFLDLRLVNKIFDEEILSYVFRESNPYETRLINGNSWVSASATLQEKYLFYILRHRLVQPNLFATLFVPILERQLKNLGIRESENDSRHALMKDWFRILMHSPTHAWVVAHKSWKFDMVLKRATTYRFADDDDDDDKSYTFETWQSRQVEADWRHARICYAILENDFDAVSCLLLEEGTPIEQLSLCFGTTILRFAFVHGNIDIFKLVLHLGWVSAQNPYEVLEFAMNASKGDDSRLSILLDHFLHLKEYGNPGKFMDDTLWCSIWKGHPIILDCALRCLKNWNIAQKWWILDRAFVNALRVGNLDIIDRIQKLRPYADLNQTFDGKSTIQLAVQAQNPPQAILHFLLDHGADVNVGSPIEAHTWIEETPYLPAVFIAAERGFADWVDILLEAGADPRGGRGELSIMWRARIGRIYEAVDLLLEKHGWHRKGWLVTKGKERYLETESRTWSLEKRGWIR